MTPKIVTWKQVRHHWEIYLLVVPTMFLIGLFQYYPAASGVYHSLFRWNGADISEYVGWRNFGDLLGSTEFWDSFRLAFIMGAWAILKLIPPIIVAVCIHRVASDRLQFLYRALFVIPMVIPPLIIALIWRSFFFEATSGYLNRFLEATGLFGLLCRADQWFHWGGIFVAGVKPAWLGDPRLIITSVVIWGFPWVGTFAVLMHLAKLGGIPKSFYEAGEIEGANWWTKFTKIELPAMVGSIYVVLVIEIINTIRDAGSILALVGIQGGPGGRGTVPALFMLRKAFFEQDMGYACAVGLVLTVVVLSLQKSFTVAMEWETQPKTSRIAVRVFGLAVGAVMLAFGRLVPLGWILLLASFPYPFAYRLLPGAVRRPADRLLIRLGIIRLPPSVIVQRRDPGVYIPQKPVRPAAAAAAAAAPGGSVPVAAPSTLTVPAAPQPPPGRMARHLLEGGKHGFIWFVLAFAFLPLYLMAIVSLKTNQQFYEAPARLSPPLHWENFTAAWRMIAPTVANSVFITISATLITIWFSLWASYFFARVKAPLTNFLWNAILILMMLPTIANLVPLFRLLGDLQLLNTLTALVVVSASGGQVYAIFTLKNFIADIPQELFDSAEVDGANHFDQVRVIVIPQAGAILGTVGVMHFITEWNNFLLPLIVMRDHDRLPVMVQLLRMSGEYLKFWGPLMAGYALASIPIIILFLFTMRLFMRGLTEGMH